jgi:1,6-anhydro-N-acetylmuramate kinase
LIDPAPVLDAYPCTILTDPRKADLEHGGQGAPITPLADWVMFRSSDASTAIVNLGGFCNVTLLPADSDPDSIRGFDVCCCNLLLDTIARRCLNEPFDHCGCEALRGSLDTDVNRQLLKELELQRTAHRSLGSEDDLGEFAVDIGQHLSPTDLLSSATSAIGSCITNAMQDVDRVYLAGGGVHNAALTNAIHHDGTTDDLGVPTQAREAMAMAILGALAHDGESITLPNITGRKETDGSVGWVYARP